MKTEVPNIGQRAPDFEVLKSDGETFSLKQTLDSGGNILLLFYRGHW
jgi:peroxiredoxin